MPLFLKRHFVLDSPLAPDVVQDILNDPLGYAIGRKARLTSVRSGAVKHGQCHMDVSYEEKWPGHYEPLFELRATIGQRAVGSRVVGVITLEAWAMLSQAMLIACVPVSAGLLLYSTFDKGVFPLALGSACILVLNRVIMRWTIRRRITEVLRTFAMLIDAAPQPDEPVSFKG